MDNYSADWSEADSNSGIEESKLLLVFITCLLWNCSSGTNTSISLKNLELDILESDSLKPFSAILLPEYY